MHDRVVARPTVRRVVPFEELGRDSAGNLSFIDSFILTYRTHMTGIDLLRQLIAASKVSDEQAGRPSFSSPHNKEETGKRNVKSFFFATSPAIFFKQKKRWCVDAAATLDDVLLGRFQR